MQFSDLPRYFGLRIERYAEQLNEGDVENFTQNCSLHESVSKTEGPKIDAFNCDMV